MDTCDRNCMKPIRGFRVWGLGFRVQGLGFHLVLFEAALVRFTLAGTPSTSNKRFPGATCQEAQKYIRELYYRGLTSYLYYL